MSNWYNDAMQKHMQQGIRRWGHPSQYDSPFTGIAAPRADRFRPGDFWRGPDGELYVVRILRNLPSHACLKPVRGGAHALLHRDSVVGFTRTRWGGEA